MAMKTKTLLFHSESNMFIGNNADNNGELGLVTFKDDCEFLKEARKLTDEVLENDKGYKQLKELSKKEICFNVDKQNLLQPEAFKAITDMWNILFHYYLIEVLRKNGWYIIEYPGELKDLELKDKNHMTI